MNISDLDKEIDIFDKHLRTTLYPDCSDKELLFQRAVKITEEVGELCSEVLSFAKIQRQHKIDRSNKETVQDEFADVIITTLLLAKSMDVDIKDALVKKIAKIHSRFESSQ